MKSVLNEFIIIAGNNDRCHVMESADGLSLLNIQPPRILIVFLRNAKELSRSLLQIKVPHHCTPVHHRNCIHRLGLPVSSFPSYTHFSARAPYPQTRAS
jgi:hypothetical protein